MALTATPHEWHSYNIVTHQDKTRADVVLVSRETTTLPVITSHHDEPESESRDYEYFVPRNKHMIHIIFTAIKPFVENKESEVTMIFRY